MAPMTRWSTRQKRAKNKEQQDYLSQLPDTLISHILSFMSTRSAVKTSVLSKRWKELWTIVPALDFSDAPSYVNTLSPTSREQKSFENFIDKVLAGNNIPNIQRFHLISFGGMDAVYVRSIDNAVTRCEIWEINLTESCSWSKVCAHLPPSLFGCEKLVLKIEGPFSINAPASFSLPSVQVICVKEIELLGGNVIKFSSSSCPVLRELTILGFSGINKLIICSLTLKKLEIRRIMWGSRDADKCIVVEEAPSIGYLVLDRNMARYNISDLSALVEAKLEIYDKGEQLLQLMTKFSSVQKLALAQSTVERFGCFSEDELPMLLSLTHLEMDIGHDMLQMLKCAPNLVHLTVNVAKSLDERRTFSLQTVPSCLLSLPTVEIQSYRGNENETELVGYLLQNAKVLKEMKIHIYNVSMRCEREAFKTLLALPRASGNCRVIICSSHDSSK